ncbi:hypothetical protein UFOVP1382_86 [uncultured Caudovirales phage]|uniref:Uncharacterized protein n=1 Tax=uncultured Caudovirales phage TaxID=2100421 RepID=A0A6J5RXT1_9CAUD|nr:hypothetical protein UFOVP1382_86 [uncultured Caudovirales phage]
MTPVVYLHHRRWLALHVREWGLPTGIYVGKAWRNDNMEEPTMTVILPGSTPFTVRFLTVRVVWTEKRERFPTGFRDAFAEYLRDWPHSAKDVRRWVTARGFQAARNRLQKPA